MVNAACSRSFTRAESILAVPRSILETVVHGVPQLQIMTWTNCGVTAEDEEVRNILLSLMYQVSFYLSGKEYETSYEQTTKVSQLVCLFACERIVN